MKYDVAVAGLGGMGSAILAQCAARGASVIGIEQFEPAHDRGSSHGRTRMIRKAYFEDAAYVPLVVRAYDLWRALEAEAGAKLLRLTGVLAVGGPATDIIAGTILASEKHDLPLEHLSAREMAARCPTLQLRPDEVALFDPDGGVLDPEGAIRAQLKVAQAHGAHVRFNTPMQSWQASDDGFEIRLRDGEVISAKRLVLALGAWFKEALGDLGLTIRVQRNVQTWFAPANESYAAARFPAFLVSRPELPAPLYGFPDFGDGVKAAFHGGGTLTDAENFDRAIDQARDIEPIVRAMDGWMPGAATKLIDAQPCMYSLTPDENFVVDRHPQHPNLILCGGFSGHGFKFAPVIGEIAADLALDGGTRHAIEFLSLRRFGTE